MIVSSCKCGTLLLQFELAWDACDCVLDHEDEDGAKSITLFGIDPSRLICDFM